MTTHLASARRLDFFRDIRDVCLDQLARLGYHLENVRGTSAQQCFRSLTTLNNVLRRRIDVRPRRFVISRQLGERVMSAAALNGLERLAEATSRGEDLNAWQSTKLDGANSKDGMLFDWGIHHLHLSAIETRVGYRARTDDLAFVVVRSDVLHVLDVGTHDDIGNHELLEIWLANWPQLLTPSRTRATGLVGGGERSAAAQRALWRAGIQTGVALSDGRVYMMMGGGINGAGSSFSDIGSANAVMVQIRIFEASVRDHAAVYDTFLLEKLGQLPAVRDYRLTVGAHDRTLVLVEHSTGVHFPGALT